MVSNPWMEKYSYLSAGLRKSWPEDESRGRDEPEKIIQPKVSLDSEILNYVQVFMALRSDKQRSISNLFSLPFERRVQLIDVETPSTKNIEKVALALSQDEVNHGSWGLGRYISHLAELAYNSGENKIKITLDDQSNINALFTNMDCDPKNPLRVMVDGSCGSDLLAYSKGIRANVEGLVQDYCGFMSESCIVRVRASAGNMLGSNSIDSQFYVRQDAIESCGSASEHSRFVIGGSVKDFVGINSHCSRFVVIGDAGDYLGRSANSSNFQVYGTIKGMVGLNSKNCTYVFHNTPGYLSESVGSKYIAYDEEVFSSLLSLRTKYLEKATFILKDELDHEVRRE